MAEKFVQYLQFQEDGKRKHRTEVISILKNEMKRKSNYVKILENNFCQILLKMKMKKL